MDENIKTLTELLKKKYFYYDAIVVEGYDGVGKGRVLSEISEYLRVTPYRPDYNLWQQYDHRKIDRWKVSGFFWEIASHFDIHPDKILLFDRGVISGAVYNNDISIAENYKKLIGDMNILHILVCCSEQDYYKFQTMRSGHITESYDNYKEYTDRYFDFFKQSGVEFIVFMNEYDEDEAEYSKDKCCSCGHYSAGWCTHPDINREVNGDFVRCSHTYDKEVQDQYDAEVHSL